MKKHLIGPGSIVLFLVCFAFIPAQGASYTKEEIQVQVKEMVTKLGMPLDKKTDLLINLDVAMNKEVLHRVIGTREIKGIIVFGANEGGFILKFMTGEGLVRFKDGVQDGIIHLKTWSLGAQIGGSTMWGVAFVVDLKEPGHFGGDYTGTVQEATAADTTTQVPIVLNRNNDMNGQMAHDLYVITSGRGFSAGLGVAKMTITRGW